MKLLPLDQLGPHELPNNRVRFGFLLLWVSVTNGNALLVKVIHKAANLSRRFSLNVFLSRTQCLRYMGTSGVGKSQLTGG